MDKEVAGTVSPQIERKAGIRTLCPYAIWSLGIFIAIAIVTVGIIAVRCSRTGSYFTPAPSAYLPEITRVSAAEVKASISP